MQVRPDASSVRTARARCDSSDWKTVRSEQRSPLRDTGGHAQPGHDLAGPLQGRRFVRGHPAALRQIGGYIAQSFPDGPDVVELTSGVTASVALGKLKRNRAVEYAEPDSTIQAADITPNDPYYPIQWGLNNPNNVDIDAPQAWSVTTGNPSTIVAVLDTGIDLHNPDLFSRLWINPTAGSDGYPGDVHGWNFVNNTPNIQDNNGHGTHVTGILAAPGNNGYGDRRGRLECADHAAEDPRRQRRAARPRRRSAASTSPSSMAHG